MMQKKEEKKRLSISLNPKIVSWLDENIRRMRFRSYHHAVEYLLSQIVEEKCIELPEDLIARIDKLVESGKLGYTNRKEFILDCIREKLKTLGYV